MIEVELRAIVNDEDYKQNWEKYTININEAEFLK